MNLKRLFFWAFIFSVLLGYVLLSEKKPVGKKEIKDNPLLRSLGEASDLIKSFLSIFIRID